MDVETIRSLLTVLKDGAAKSLMSGMWTTLCGGVIMLYIKSLKTNVCEVGSKVKAIEKTITDMPKEYKLKEDCKSDMHFFTCKNQEQHKRLRDGLNNQRDDLTMQIGVNASNISKLKEDLAYKKGLKNGKKGDGYL